MSDPLTQLRQERHAQWFAENTSALEAAGVTFYRRETAYLFRPRGGPAVDFYPHTGRWRTVGPKGGRTFRGGAKAFLSWYAKQRRSTP